MPMYDWRCTRCQLDVSTLRPFSESDTPPSEDDISDSTAGKTDLPACLEHKWTKVILKAPGLSFTGSWGYGNGGRGKGSW
jgi:hypothetical protein